MSSWLDSFPPGEPMPDSAAHFMYMLEALDENGLARAVVCGLTRRCS